MLVLMNCPAGELTISEGIEHKFTVEEMDDETYTGLIMYKWVKLDGVGPFDNRPSTDKIHHFVRGKKKKYM